MSEIDYLIVGSGLFGSVCAYELNKAGYKVVVLEKRNHVGGNVFCENVDGINVHKYGAHIFHTNDDKIWRYVNEFVEFNRFTNSPKAFHKGKLYSLPFNMNTFSELWGISKPSEAKKIIEDQRKVVTGKPKNLEEQAISLVGVDVYEKLIKEYTAKQWGRDPKDLPAFIIKRLPVRFTYDNNYFNDKYQGIPIGGYNKIIEKMLDGIDVRIGIDYLKSKESLGIDAKKIIYTGPIDEYFNFEFGKLEYRSLTFETQVLKNCDNFQGNAVVNYSDKEFSYTRIIEHKHFESTQCDHTVITKEFPADLEEGKEPYYPINDVTNNEIFRLYRDKSKNEKNVIFGGRLAEYKYYDMHQVIASALKTVSAELNLE